tara:strand:- start:965 stop:1351 length:387 start_codon:yes stop_codon:yes gene_type:complete
LIKTSKEIIQDTAKQLKVPEHQVQAVYDTIVKYVHLLTKSPNVVAIRLPQIGTLYSKLSYIVKKVKSSKHTDTVELYKSKESIIKSDIDLNKKNYNNRHLKRDKIEMKYFNKGMTIEDIENLQNGKEE